MAFNIGYAVGGGAAALQEIIQQRFKQTQLEEQLRAQQVQEARQAEELKLQQQQESRVAAHQTAVLDDLKFNREATRVNNIADDMMPGDVMSPEDAELFKKHGRGGMLRTKLGREAESALDSGSTGTSLSFDQFLAEGAAKKGTTVDQLTKADRDEAMHAYDAMQTGSVGTLKTKKTVEGEASQTVSRGGTKWLDARAKEQARIDADKAKAEEATARQRERLEFVERENKRDRDLKEMMGRLASAGQAESRDIRNRMLELQIQGIQDKQDTARTEKEKTLIARTETTDSGLDLIDSMLVHPGFGKATGAYDVRGWTQEAQDFNGLRDQLVATLTLPNVGQLKGPLSDKDVAFIKQTVTRLGNTKLSSEATRADLEKIREKLSTARERIAEEASRGTRSTTNTSGTSSTTTSAIPEYVRDPNTGKLVLKK